MDIIDNSKCIEDKIKYVTFVSHDDIFKLLESLRKMGLKAYVLQWASNTNDDFVIFTKTTLNSNILFDLQIESSMHYRKEHSYSNWKKVSNNVFKQKCKQLINN